MAGSVNKVILIGNLGADPEVRHTQDGRPVVNLRIATTETWRDRNTGERRERTEWHRVVIFNEGLARVAEQYLRKGSKVYIEGQLQTRKWTDQNGIERYTTEVVLQGFNCALTMLDSRGAGQAGAGFGTGMPAAAGAGMAGGMAAGMPGDMSPPMDMGGMDAPAPSSSPGGQPAAAPQDFSKDLDDDVPF